MLGFADYGAELAPGIGPAVGGFLGAWFGWRSIFVALVALGVVTLGGVPAGSFASSRLASRVRATSAIAMLGAALFFGAAVSAVLSLATVLLPMMLFSVGVGASEPVAITSAISTDPKMIGAASGLYGFMQVANGAA